MIAVLTSVVTSDYVPALIVLAGTITLTVNLALLTRRR